MSKVSDQEDHATPQSRVMARQVVNLEKLAEAQLGSRRGAGGGTWTFNDNLVTLVGRDVVVQSDLLMGVVNVWRGRRCIACYPCEIGDLDAICAEHERQVQALA